MITSVSDLIDWTTSNLTLWVSFYFIIISYGISQFLRISWLCFQINSFRVSTRLNWIYVKKFGWKQKKVIFFSLYTIIILVNLHILDILYVLLKHFSFRRGFFFHSYHETKLIGSSTKSCLESVGCSSINLVNNTGSQIVKVLAFHATKMWKKSLVIGSNNNNPFHFMHVDKI